MKKINKKGIIDDFGSLLIAGLIMVAIAIMLMFASGQQSNVYRDRHLIESNLRMLSYSTITILDWELNSQMKVYESLIKHEKENTLDVFAQELYEALEAQGLTTHDTWMLVIKPSQTTDVLVKDTSTTNGFLEIEPRGRRNEQKRNSFLALPRIKVPNGERGGIEIIIRQVTNVDINYYSGRESLSPGMSPVV